MVRARVDEAVRRLDLIKREEFEAMAELAKRARTQSEALELRVAALEAKAPTAKEPAAEEPVVEAPAAAFEDLPSAPDPAPETEI